MRKLLILCFLCFTWIARGQDEYRWHYWFDANYDAGVSGTTQSRLFTIDADASSLDFGAHTFNFQVEDKDGVSSSPVSKYFYYSNSTIDKLTYWFDNDTKNMKEESGMDGHFMLDVSSIEPGIHFINLMLKDASGRISEIKQECFYRVINKTATKLTYWFDDDESTKETIAFHDGTSMFDVSKLQEGFHTISIVTHDYTSSAIATRMFIKVPQTQGDFDMVCLCSVDGKLVAQDRLPSTGGILNFDLDVNNIDPGLHKAIFQTITPTGAASNTVERYFIRTTTNNEIGTMKCLYSIDDAKTYTQAGNFANGLFHFDLDVASLADGLHRLAYMLIADNGVSTPMQSAFFWKTPVGGNAIIQYDYWLNENEANAKKVTLAERNNPFSLITLLPIESCPIRSSCFQFEVKDGKPMMYARNDIHFRFFDVAGRLAEITKQFVDYSISQEVTDITEIKSTQTFERPRGDEIKWFSLQAEKGDTIAFKSSQAATIQVFSPTGEEVYSVNGSNSVAFGGCHTWENGTYYVAIHDVTGSNSRMSCDFMQMGKFTLLTNSSPALGSLPAVQIITIDGNGFDNLKTASITLGDKSLLADSIAHISNQIARLYWLFDGSESLGNYNIVLHFDDGEEQRDVLKNNFVTLIKPSFDDITIEVSDPRRVAVPYPVYITVTNNSNIAYQAIPFYFAIDHIESMQSVKYLDFTVGCCKELYDAGLKLSFEYDSFKGNNSKTRVVPTIIPELLPGETKTFTLGVNTRAHQIFNVYAWKGIPWNLLAPETSEYIKSHYSEIKAVRVKNASGIAGIFDGCEDDPCSLANVGSALADCACGTALALGGTLGGIQNALQNQHNRAMRQQLAQSGLFDDPNEYFPDRHLPSPEDLMWYWLQHCLPGKAGQAVSTYNEGRQMLGDDPCQDPPAHQCNAYNPGDPNEIHGTVSESGSKYLMQETSKVSYTIEFENNPELANASAHKIVVCDTLDTDIFDVSSFMQSSVKIGDKHAELDGSQNSIQTIDMRPEINAIAQVETEFNQKKGIAKWTITSLDPMSMEETYDIMQGVLPVNNGGNGIGFISYDISLKHHLDNGDSFSNRAGITFDFETPILTPVWINTIDAVAPESMVVGADVKNDSTATVKVQATDNLSGAWKYDVYVRYGSEGSSWYKAIEGATTDEIDVKYYKELSQSFCVVATDSAGNVEQKELVAEFELSNGVLGDANVDGFVNVNDITTIATFILQGKVSPWSKVNADANEDGTINVNDITKTAEIILLRAKAEMEAKAAMEAKAEHQ